MPGFSVAAAFSGTGIAATTTAVIIKTAAKLRLAVLLNLLLGFFTAVFFAMVLSPHSLTHFSILNTVTSRNNLSF